ncbi:unnamed protein product [Amaranthus hypochondriacus]
MKATLFEDDIQAYEDLIQQSKEYMISNPTIRTVDEKYQSKVGEFQMTFNNRTIIQPTGSSSASGPTYHALSNIPRIASPYDRYDVLGIVLFVGDVRKVAGAFCQQNSVCEILITDHSSHQPLTISAWNDLADFFKEKPVSYPIIGFTSLKVTSHKGFGLSTTMSTTFILTPSGDKAAQLNHWASTHGKLLDERKAQVLETRTPLQERGHTTIAFIKNKKANNTIQDERYFIKAFIPTCSYDDIRKFLGCGSCNKKTDTDKYKVYTCQWCHKKDSISMPRLALTFDAVDDTDSINLTAFNDDVAKLFGKTIDALYAPTTSEDITTYEEIASSFKNKAICIEVGPTTALSKNGVLKWVLKSILVEPLPTQANQSPIGKLQTTIASKPINQSEIVVGSPTPTKSESAQLFSSTSVAGDQHTSLTPNSNPSTAASSSSPNPLAQELQVRRRLEFGHMECSSKPDDSTC